MFYLLKQISMRIFVIHPTTENLVRDAGHGLSSREERIEIVHLLARTGAPALASNVDSAQAVPTMVQRVSEAEAAGADAVVLSCVGDPGAVPARDVATAPVVAAGQTAMTVAGLIAENFSVIVPDDGAITIIERLARLYCLSDKLRSVRSVGSSMDTIRAHGPDVLERLKMATCKAIEEDGAHAVVLGCAGFAGFEGPLTRELEARHHHGIPVIEPISTALRIGEALARLGLSHSKRSHPTPAPGEHGWDP